jgi:hypothetical protein
MSRFVALAAGPIPHDWLDRAAREVRSCDWWISAESAGVEDDDPAVRLTVIAGARPVVEKHKVTVDHGRAGKARIELLSAGEVAGLRPPQRIVLEPGHGYSLLLEDLDGPGGRLLLAAYLGVAIGLSRHGAVRTPEGEWWDASQGTWVR